MTEKRFRFNGDTHILDTETNKQFYAPSENGLLDLLNSLYDENEQLKQQINDLSKENIHLDARVMDLQERLMNR